MIDCLAKKVLVIDSTIRWSSFARDNTNISFENYCGSFYNRFCKILYQSLLSSKKEKKKKFSFIKKEKTKFIGISYKNLNKIFFFT